MDPVEPRVLSIGEWRVDPALDQISRGGTTLKLEPRAMRLLLCLAAHAGRVVEVQRLLDEAWPGVVVTPASVYQVVAQLRRQLGDDSEHPTYIDTVPRKGYRLIAPVAPWPAEPATLDRAEAAAPAPAAPTTTPAPAPRPDRRWAIALGAVALALLAAGATWFVRSRQAPAAGIVVTNVGTAVTAPVDPSIVVLPFRDLSEGHHQEYFADGMTAELSDRLAQIPGLRVVAQSSAFAVKGSTEEPTALARRLGASYVLEGTVRGAGDLVRVTASLVRGEDGFELWSKSYDRRFDDILKVQDEIATTAARDLRVGLVTVGPPPRRTPRSMDAYRLLLQAEYLLRRGGPGDFDAELALLEAAVKKDPDYSDAWVSLGLAWMDASLMAGEVPPEVAMPKAHAAMNRALETAPESVRAHLAAATIKLYFDWDWDGADAEIRRSFELAPDSVWGLSVRANLAHVRGHYAEAARLIQQRLSRDPLSTGAYEGLADSLACAGRWPEAEAAARRGIALAPQIGSLHDKLFVALLGAGRAEAALAALTPEVYEAARLERTAEANAVLGRRAASDAALGELEKRFATSAATGIALAHAYRGELDPAFRWFERAYAQHEPKLVDSIRCTSAPPLRPLREHPRYRALLERLHLAE